MNRFRAVSVVLAVALLTTLTGAAHAADPTRYASFTIGRGVSHEAVDCRPAPGSVGVLRLASIAHARGVPMGLNLIPARLDEAAATGSRYCDPGGRILTATWRDAATLRDRFGWHHQTSGLTYQVITTLSPEQQRREACRALDRLRAKGHLRGHGLFAPSMDPARDSTDDASARNVREACGYVWVRDYGQETWSYRPSGTDGAGVVWANDSANLHPAGYVRMTSVNGGSCPASWGCGAGGDRDYMEPELLLRHLRAAPGGSHVGFQLYRVVEGNQPGRWKCSGPSGTHYTYEAEVYCLEDLRVLLDGIPDDVVVTDPLTVAQAWGLAP